MSSLAADLKKRLPQPQRSLAGRLVWLAAIWSVVALIATGIGLSAFFDRAATDRFDQRLAADADDLYAGTSINPDGSVAAPFLIDVRATRAYSGKYWQIAEERPDGTVHALPDARSRSIFDADDLPMPARELARMKATPKGRIYYSAPGPHDQPLRIAAMQRVLAGRAAPVIFMTAEDRSTIDRDVRRFTVTTAVALVLLGAGLVSAVILQVRVGLRPLFEMGRDVARVRKGGAERLTRPYPRELAPLAGELNALLDHNQEVVERQRTHVGNLAHALKTPISVMLSEADGRTDPMAEVVRRQAELMRGQVEHHLRRARAAARSQSAGERTAVAPVMDELARTLDRIYGGKGVDIDWDAPTDLAFQGERQDLLEMAGNLMENACKYSHGQVVATAEALGEGALRITIRDDGPGLAPEARDAALKRGQRFDETAPGSGLGLAIVDELARAYGGALVLGEATALGGLQVELTLPRAAA